MALEIQHSSDVILAAGQPLLRLERGRPAGAAAGAVVAPQGSPRLPARPDAKAVAEVAETLSAVEDEQLRAALARLGASIKRNRACRLQSPPQPAIATIIVSS